MASARGEQAVELKTKGGGAASLTFQGPQDLTLSRSWAGGDTRGCVRGRSGVAAWTERVPYQQIGRNATEVAATHLVRQ